MKFCLKCGSDQTDRRIPEGDNRQRAVCINCGYIHYLNPRNIAGCILESEQLILLCRRAIEPRYGTWTIPAGFMENGESLAQAAAREAQEEARASSQELKLHSVHSLPHISQVYVFFRGQLQDGYHAVGEESLETRLFSEQEIPWDDLAFPVIKESLRLFFSDRRRGEHQVHLGDILRLENGDYQHHLHD